MLIERVLHSAKIDVGERDRQTKLIEEGFEALPAIDTLPLIRSPLKTSAITAALIIALPVPQDDPAGSRLNAPGLGLFGGAE